MNDLADFAACLERAAALAEKQPPCMSLLIDEEGLCVDLVLDTKRATISEWIRGEGADICLYRDRDTGKVVGCHLPLYQKELRVSKIEKPKSIRRSVMPKSEKDRPFTVVISLDIKKDGLPYFRGESQYSNTGYATVVGVQQLLIGVLNRLGEAGVELAMEKGLEDELRLLGVLGVREKAEIEPKG